MCHLFSVVSPYALPFLRRLVLARLGRSEGNRRPICNLVVSQSPTDELCWGWEPWAECICGSDSTSATAMARTSWCDLWVGSGKGQHLHTGRKRRVGLLGESLWSTCHGYEISRLSLALWFPFFLGRDLHKPEELLGGWYLQPLYFPWAKNTLQTWVLFSIPNSWAPVWREWMCYPTVKTSKQVERTRERRKRGWGVWF